MSEMRTVVDNCRADIGRCPVGSCSTKETYKSCPHDGYICPETETRKVECASGEYKYQYVKRCVCCEDNGIVVNLIVLDAATKSALENIAISIKGRFVGLSDGNGSFKLNIKSQIRNVVVSAKDKNKNYMDAVKIVDIPEYFRSCRSPFIHDKES